MRINLLLKITLVALVLLGLSLRSAVSAGGSDEEVFPPKTLEKLKKNYTSQQKKTKNESSANESGDIQESKNQGSNSASSTKNKEKSGCSRMSFTSRARDDKRKISKFHSFRS